MQKVYLSEIEDGTPIAYDLYNAQGAILVSKGTKITTTLKEKLQKNNIIHLTTNVSPFEAIDDRIEHLDEPVIKKIQEIKKVYKKTFQSISEEFERYKSRGTIDALLIEDIVQDLMGSIYKNQQVYMNIQGIRRKDAYTYLHSVDVSIFMILFANSMNFDKKDIEAAAIAGMLHDIGKTKIRNSILLKPDKLSDEEMEIMKRHTLYGYDILKNQLGYKEDIARVAREHHEKFDGTGYPERRKWKDLHVFSKMVMICDIYDAITAERVYKKAMLPHKAIEYLMSIIGSHVEHDLVRKFIHNIAVYPLGTKVILNTEEEGIVIRNNRGFPLRPVVKIIDSKKRRDLLVELTVFITEVL
ncbi:HDIG domain-containing protein [Natronincola peptidivorans]|uniref:HDIG domain-containing protein n=1 Tax=Natronincola peptidivorans TaxID=426128 RepID=A0A1I0G972_9FIRM|nr:HD-GYP domain-containing protein [Natronincola peptidivorans]SET66634.1 HDIG domain-containing protein [Natronincola peptidivorans]